MEILNVLIWLAQMSTCIKISQCSHMYNYALIKLFKFLDENVNYPDLIITHFIYMDDIKLSHYIP
jgi:hypothetical protein